MEIINKSIKELNELLIKKEIKAVELLEEFLKRIEQYDKKINSFITIFKEEAYQTAREVDKLLEKKEQINLISGIPIGIKDNICTKNIKTTCASKMLSNFIPPYDATVIKKIKEQKGIIIGKTNLDEFAMGSSTETSYFGVTKNPFNYECIAGGSSGGSAAAVSARFVPYTLGSDTGGSIRQPAALCGVSGLKPSYGLVSRYGLIAYASSLDQIGPIAKSAEDCAILLDVIAGKDEFDSTSVNFKKDNYLAKINGDIKGIKIGIPREFFQEGLNDEIKINIENTIKFFEKEGGIIKDISLTMNEYVVATYYILAPAEASSNLARYDGVKYGYRTEKYENLIDMYEKTRAEGFGNEVKRRIMLGTYTLSAGYYDAYYKKAQQVRSLIRNELIKKFEEVDVIIAPTTPTPAFKIGEKINNPLEMYLFDIYTLSVNLAGICAISIPCGFTKDNLPCGLQIIGNAFEEAKILKLAHYFQQQTDYHKKIPFLK